jgi:multicomponent Na+:H+ antiporter subunit D
MMAAGVMTTGIQGVVALPIVLPLLGAAAGVVFGAWRQVQRAITLVTLVSVLGVSTALLIEADSTGYVVQSAGGWAAPLGIVLVVDRLAGIMLVVSAIVLLAVAVYAIGQAGEERQRVAFHPLYLVLAAGVSASFITGDLFNLFVAFEMMLAASYVLITLGGRPDQIRSGMSYVVISLVASTLFISALALLYAATGTVNMADLSQRLGEVSPELRTGFSLLLLVVFGIKAGLFPLFFWLPDSYPTASGPVTAIFAGLLTKVGVYAIIRTQTLLFEPGETMGTVLLWVAGATMVVGVIGAIAQDDMKRILAFHIISQIGYMILGLGLFTVAGIAGAVFYVIHHIVVKTALFLVAGLVDRRAGSARLSEVGGLVRSAPVISALFLIPALSLAGLPPFSGFLAKFALVDAGIEGRSWWIVATSLVVGLFTLFSMTKIWTGVFWGEADEAPGREPVVTDRLGSPLLMLVGTLALVGVSIAFSIAAGSLYELSERAAEDLLDPGRYVVAVLGERP